MLVVWIHVFIHEGPRAPDRAANLNSSCPGLREGLTVVGEVAGKALDVQDDLPWHHGKLLPDVVLRKAPCALIQRVQVLRMT